MKISPACQASHSINSQDDINQIILKFRQNGVVNRVGLVPLAACRGLFRVFSGELPPGAAAWTVHAEGAHLRFFFEIVDCVTHGLPGRL
jgi:hypothetical protein